MLGGLANGGLFTTDQYGNPQYVSLPGGDHSVVSQGGLTVLVGTGGPRQTVYGKNGQVDAPLRIVPGPGHGVNGVGHQTVYHPSGDVTVLVGTGGPYQTVHHGSSHGSSHFSGQTTAENNRGVAGPGSRIPGETTREIDNIQQHKNGEQRGDQPGYLITPGQIRDSSGELGQQVKLIYYIFNILN